MEISDPLVIDAGHYWRCPFQDGSGYCNVPNGPDYCMGAPGGKDFHPDCPLSKGPIVVRAKED